MKRLFAIPMLLMLIASVGCQEQVITRLEVGKEKLLGAGLAIEAVEDLKAAETKEAKTEIDKVEPRALLLIAYSHALETGDAKSHGVAAQYEQERSKRLAAMNDAEMRRIFDLFNERNRTHQATKQIFIDKGALAVPLLIGGLGHPRYAAIREDVVDILRQVGPGAVGGITSALRDPNTTESVKATLISILGQINAPEATSALAELQSNSDPQLKMEINVALYQLGKKEYRSQIIDGLSDSNVAVRRAAAKAMPLLNDSPPTDKILKVLGDNDAAIRMYAAQTLEKYPTQEAVAPLVDILKSDSDESVKQAAKQSLIVHAEQPYGKGLARRLIQMLPNVSDPQDRVRIALLLRSAPLIEQIKKAPETYEDNIKYDLYQYYTEKEQIEQVKEQLSQLLNEIDR
jgi:HEAT repeat protein